MLDIYVDADGCPVKNEVYRVARRYDLRVFLVSNSFMRTPPDERFQFIEVGDGLDAADDWIAERIEATDIAITTDIPLASRCLKKGARVLGPKGVPFTEDAIGEALATRELKNQLREMGIMSGGPAPFEPRDSSRFLSKLDEAVNAIRRGR